MCVCVRERERERKKQEICSLADATATTGDADCCFVVFLCFPLSHTLRDPQPLSSV